MRNIEVKLSIAIVTRNRSSSLRKTLECLQFQSIKPYETIISDDSDIDMMINENRVLASKYDCLYIIGPKKGLYANRNFVAEHCAGTHFRTMDDDHCFPMDHLAKCLDAIYNEPETIWTIGEYEKESDVHLAPHPVPGQLHPRGFSYYNNRSKNYYGISCGATIYPRSVLTKKILNCELYRFGILYLEYGARLKSMGYTLKPLFDAYIIHDSTLTTASEVSRMHYVEARIFAMFCLSFYYDNTLINQVGTFYQLLFDYLNGKTNFTLIKSAFLNYKKFTEGFS